MKDKNITFILHPSSGSAKKAMESISPITQKRYIFPGAEAEKERIRQFLERNKGKKIAVVQGLGFVGSVMALVIANSLKRDHAVIGVDLPEKDSYWKVGAINEGEFPVVSTDPKVDSFFAEAREHNTLMATTNPVAYEHADHIVVDIDLDAEKDPETGALIDVPLSPIKEAIRTAGERCKADALFLVETTVPPGTCEHVIFPLLKDIFRDRGCSTTPFLAHSYERVMPGRKYVDSIRNFYRVYSGIDEKSQQKAHQFLNEIIRTDQYPLTKLKNTTASEMAKVLENSYRAMNIAFIQEWTEFSEVAGVDLYEVIQAIRKRPTHKNIMLPGLGVGGYCLTKDPLLASWSKKHLFGSTKALDQSEKAVRINDTMPLYTFEQVKALSPDIEGKKVLLLGVSYLSDIGDTRYTPVSLLYNALKKEGCEITLHDPFVPYWEEKGIKVEQDIEKVLDAPDVIILSTAHTFYKEPPFTDRIAQMENRSFVDAWGGTAQGHRTSPEKEEQREGHRKRGSLMPKVILCRKC